MASEPATVRRILHIASWYPSEVHGTLGNFVERHVQAISTLNGGEVWFAAAVPAGDVVPANTVCDHGTYTERIFYFRARKPIVWQVSRALLRAAEEATPFDLIHLHVAYPAGRAARTLARRWNVPLVLTEHWTAYHAEQRNSVPSWRRWAMRATGHAASVICPVSEDLASSMRAFGITGTFNVVPNVVNTKLFHPSASPFQGSTFNALHISSLRDDQKNISGLLRASRKALDRCDALRISIIGDGDPQPHRAYARSLGLDERVEIAGEIPLVEVAERMRAADALVLFSRYENFPCVIPEAWASGIPVLSTDVGGIREHLTPERGALVASEDENALTDALCTWAKDGAPSNASDLRNHAEAVFSMAAVARAYTEVYTEAVTRQTAAQ
ncbi:MAG: hypothetical protein CL828_06410 [Crocinitomicaceae bacterium]|nr:hypothetical protein [Crocinitomicaceae bacterium]